MTVDAQIDDTTLREFYLRPFEATVIDAGAWGVMSSYNKLNGQHAANNGELLQRILRDDWGYDGFVVSDWFGAHDYCCISACGAGCANARASNHLWQAFVASRGSRAGNRSRS